MSERRLPISSSDAKGSTKIKREASSTIVTKTKTSCTAVTKRRKIGQMSIKDEELEEYRQKLPKKEFIKALFPPDLRHSYSRIIVDAFNTGNSTLMIDALKSFCAPNVSVREYFTGVDNPYGPNYRELCGYEAIATYWNIISSAIPDGIITVKNTKAKPVAKVPDSFSMVIDSPEFDERDTSSEDNSEPNGGSAFGESLAFINSYSFNGTKLLDIVTQQHKFAKNPPIFGPEVPDYGPSSIYLVPTRDNIDNKIRPDVRLEGSWVILLDKNNKISRFEFHYRNALERRNL